MGEGTDRGHSDARVPGREVCVMRNLIDRMAEERGDQVYAVFENGDRWTYAELRRRVRAMAAGLQRLGVTQGEFVGVWMPSGREALLTFFAINYAGAVFVPFNTAYRGAILEHVLKNSGARLLILHAGLTERLGEVALAEVERLVVLGVPAVAPGLPCCNFAEVAKSDAPLRPLERAIEPWDIQSVIYTSGTTGPSKGVISSYLHMYSNGGPESWPFVTGQDRYLVNMPVFHIGGMGIPFVMLARGGSIALMESFSTERFWEFARSSGSTVIFLLGVMATFLMKAAPSPRERDHGVRLVMMVPLTDVSAAFRERFGTDVYTIFNMTEVSSPIVSEANPTRIGTCGRPRPGVEVRLVDAHDCEVPVGVVGEMLVRTDRPWAMNSGYLGAPEATARAWANGWFHTGDAFRRDADGYFYFVDRVKDAIRRRGENISSFEVETAILAHPHVREAAVVGVPSEFSEEDVMAVLAPNDGCAINPAELLAFLEPRLPYFMIPRYVRVLPELPKTSSAKVKKADLRAEGIPRGCWDREQAGIKLKRDRL